MWTKIRVLLQGQSDLGLHCLTKRLLNHFSRLGLSIHELVTDIQVNVYTGNTLSRLRFQN